MSDYIVKHDRMQPNVDFRMGAHGFVLSVGKGTGMMPIMYAFSTIEEVADWFLDQYRQAPPPIPGTPETGLEKAA